MGDDVIRMTSEETAVVKNIPSNRTVLYVIPIAVTSSLIILLLGYFHGESLIGIFALIPIVGLVLIFLASRNRLGGVRVDAEGIQLVFNMHGSIMMPWKYVTSLEPVKLDPGMYKLKGLTNDRRAAILRLSEEPAEEVRRMWSKLFPDGRDISEDAHTRFPTSHER